MSINLKEKICSRPFTEMLITPEGRVSPCCYLDDQREICGNINNESLFSIWNNEKFQALRNEFIEGKIETCRSEIIKRNCAQIYRQDILEFTSISKKTPYRIDLRISGECNLKCQMCEYGKDGEVVSKIDINQHDLIPFLEKAKDIHLLGGEPLIVKDNFQLIEQLSKTNPECVWGITTNGHWTLTDSMKSLFKKINLSYVIVSIDSLQDELYEKIRKKGKLKTVFKTLNDLQAFSKERPFRLQVDMVLQKENAYEVEDFLKFSREHSFDLGFIFLEAPINFSLATWGGEEKRKYITYLKKLGAHDARVGTILSTLLETL